MMAAVDGTGAATGSRPARRRARPGNEEPCMPGTRKTPGNRVDRPARGAGPAGPPEAQAWPTEARPWLNRPAWLFSARASVSNQSAISSKPSSRAVRAKPGYISVYS